MEAIHLPLFRSRFEKWMGMAIVCGLVLAVGAGLGSASPVGAELELLGGATYNTYSLDWGLIDPEDSQLPFNSGWGFYGGAQYWVSPSLAIGGQFETFTGSGRERWILADGTIAVRVGIKGNGTGYLATLAAPIATEGPIDATVFAAVGVYDIAADVTLRADSSGGTPGAVAATGRLSGPSQVGGKFGVTVGKRLRPGLAVAGQLAYRLVPAFQDLRLEVLGLEQDWVADRGIDVSGVSAGVGFVYSF